MKRIKLTYWALVAVVAGSLASCSKAIEKDPTHTVDGDNFFTKIEDYERALTGSYSLLLRSSHYGTSNTGANSAVGIPDVLSDNVFQSSEALGNFQDYARWSYTADDASIGGMWTGLYNTIQQANLTLRNIDNFASSSPGAVNRIKAQAIALRAYLHFDLLRYFGEASARTSTARGIAYVDKFDVEQKPARLTVQQSYDRIEADLKLAKSLMLSMDKAIQTTGTGGADRAYIDDMVVNAMLARMYMNASSLDSAVKYATLVINARPLISRANFPNIWLDATTTEVIWSIKFQSTDAPIGSVIYYSVGNRAEFRPGPDVLALYDQANDVRYSSYFRILPRGNRVTGNPATNRVVLIKHDAKQANLSRPDGIVNAKAFRTGEMYLIRAEAYARLGGANEASGLADLNTLRAARINGYVPVVLAGQPLIDAIATERRKELIFEGARFLDLKRTTKVVNRLNNCIACNLPSNAREWTFPIPQTEIQANPNIEQSNGY